MAAFSSYYHHTLLPHYYSSSVPVNSNASESAEPIKCLDSGSSSLFGSPQPQILVNSSSSSSSLVLMESKKKRTSSEAHDAKTKNRKQAAADQERRGGGGREEEEEEAAPPTGYIHVRARRGQATDSHSLAERVRREKIRERMNLLQGLAPGCDKITGKALMLEEIINYVQSLQNQVAFLSMKLACMNPSLCDFGLDLMDGQAKDQAQQEDGMQVAAAAAATNRQELLDQLVFHSMFPFQ